MGKKIPGPQGSLKQVSSGFATSQFKASASALAAGESDMLPPSSVLAAGPGLLESIQELCSGPVVPKIYLTKEQHWVIGPYHEFIDENGVARKLRIDEDLLEKFSGARFGRRAGETLPTGDPTSGGFREKIEGKAPKQVLLPADVQKKQGVEFDRRITTHYDEAREFFAKRTLEAHHIVEKAILGYLGVNKGALADHCAPCVLIVAELHKRLFTPDVAKWRGTIASKMERQEKIKELKVKYEMLYSGDLLAPLREIALLILNSIK